MNHIDIVLVIIAASTAFSVIYLFFALLKYKGERKPLSTVDLESIKGRHGYRVENIIKGFMMLFCPLAGPIYFIGQHTVYMLLRKEKVMQLDDIGFSKERHNRVVKPDMDTETQSVPLEEVFLIAENEDKRKHLLFELKKDYISNYGIIIKALDNEDPETSHYAASAITNAKAGFENDLKELDSLYGRNMKDTGIIRRYADYVRSYLRSGVLDPIESQKYRYLLINLLTGVKSPNEFLNEKDYSDIVNEAIMLKEFTIAEQWARTAHKLLKNESTYMNLLKVYYKTDRTKQFFELLEEMKKSDISLSYDGLSLVRFFIWPVLKGI